MVGLASIDNTVKGRLEALHPERKGGVRGLAKNQYVLWTAVFASIGGFLFGYDQGVMSNLLTTENFGANFPRVYKDEDIKGWIVSVLQLGAWFGALANGPIAQKFSRKYSMINAVVFFCLGSALQAGARNEDYLFAGRFIAGMAIGALSHVVPMYQSEVAPPEIRGSLVSLQQFAITIGILVAFWLDYGFHFIGGVTCNKDGSSSYTGPDDTFNPPQDVPPGGCNGQSVITWRVPLALQIVPALILAVGMIFLPFSPRWLILKGRDEEALCVLARLRRLPTDDDGVRTEWLEIKAMRLFEEQTAAEKFPGFSGLKLDIEQYKTLFTRIGLFRRLATGCVLQFFQQFTGINAIIYYAPTIFSSLGLDGNTTSLLATGVVGIINVIFTIPSILYLDRLGRRKALIAGAIGMCISHVIVAAIIGEFADSFSTHRAAGWAGVAFIYVFIANFAYSFGPIGWVLPAEIMPLSVRSKAMSISTSANWMCNFAVGRMTPSMIANITYGTYIFFAVFCLLAAFWVFFFVPETKNKTLEEMDAVFKDNTSLEDTHRMREANRQVGLETKSASEEKEDDMKGDAEAGTP